MVKHTQEHEYCGAHTRTQARESTRQQVVVSLSATFISSTRQLKQTHAAFPVKPSPSAPAGPPNEHAAQALRVLRLCKQRAHLQQQQSNDFPLKTMQRMRTCPAHTAAGACAGARDRTRPPAHTWRAPAPLRPAPHSRHPRPPASAEWWSASGAQCEGTCLWHTHARAHARAAPGRLHHASPTAHAPSCPHNQAGPPTVPMRPLPPPSPPHAHPTCFTRSTARSASAFPIAAAWPASCPGPPSSTSSSTRSSALPVQRGRGSETMRPPVHRPPAPARAHQLCLRMRQRGRGSGAMGQ